jgi:hypothetical protein
MRHTRSQEYLGKPDARPETIEARTAPGIADDAMFRGIEPGRKIRRHRAACAAQDAE